jgi:hypothetical protein
MYAIVTSDLSKTSVINGKTSRMVEKSKRKSETKVKTIIVDIEDEKANENLPTIQKR